MRGTTLTCQAETSVDRNCCVPGPPSIELTGDPPTVEPWEEVDLRASPKVGDCAKIDKVTIDGQEVGSPYGRVMRWDVPGTYTVTANVMNNYGASASDSVTITVTECRTKDCKKRVREVNRGTGTTGWILRPWIGGVQTSDDEVLQSFDNDFERRRVDLGSGSAFGIEAEYQFKDWFGLGLGILSAEPDAGYQLDLGELWAMDEDGLEMSSFYAGPLFHLTPRSRVDLFVGPFVAFTDFDDLEFSALGINREIDFDSEFGFGLKLGLDIPFRPDGNWGLHLGTIYLDATAETDPPDFELDVDPWLFNVGLSYRFHR